MLPRTSIVAAAASFLALALGVGWYGFHAARRAEASLAAINRALGRLHAGVRQADERAATRKRDIDGLQAALQKALADAQVNRPAGHKDPATLMAADHTLRDLYLKSFRANMMRRFGGIYQILGLSPVQIDRFEELATACEGDKWTIRAAALAQGFAPNDPAIDGLQKQNLEQLRAAVANELGTAVAQQLDQVGRLEPAQGLVDDAGSLVAPGTPPLTNSQDAQLLQLLAISSDGYQAGGKFDPSTVDWDKASAQAATILSGSQLEAFNAEAQLARVVAMVNQFYSHQKAAK